MKQSMEFERLRFLSIGDIWIELRLAVAFDHADYRFQ